MEVARASRVLQQLPQLMEIGATPGKGKDNYRGNGKGKQQKGKDKTKDSGKYGGKGNPHADKKCHHCGKTGHIKSECRKKAAEDRAAAGKGNGKPKGKGKGGKAAGAMPEEEPEPVSGALMPGPQLCCSFTSETDDPRGYGGWRSLVPGKL